VNNRVQAAEAAASRVFEIIDTPTETTVAEPAAVAEPVAFNNGIAFQNVSFAYPNATQQQVLSNINLTIDKGEVVALVGPNGSGKTTLMALLLRFFDPTTGRIIIDGQDIRELPLAQLRALFGLVPQDAVIFSGSVHDNIAYGANGVTPAAVEEAARLAHLDEFLETLSREHAGDVTRGVDTRINAKSLSGGQKQRLALARAILRDPAVLILDEATSQIDAESEAKIQAALNDVTEGRTVLIIAHRFSTIRHADRIIVLDRGEIVGSGPHEQLLESCPVYAALAQTQLVHGA
jgi:ABC-type multidrug transport system fused ATPase/permease subunit